MNSPVVWESFNASERDIALEVLLHGPTSRLELSERTGLSTASLSRLTKPLLEAGVLYEVEETERRPATGGRPRQPLDVVADLGLFVGIKLTEDHAYGVLTNLRSEQLATASITLTSQEPDPAVRDLAGLIDALAQGRPPVAAGVCLGGAVVGHSRVRSAPFLRWKDVDLGARLSALTSLPAVISNDLDSLMEIERWFGLGRDLQNFAVLTIGAGVGTGAVINWGLVTSPDAGFGLLGHQPIDACGPTCDQGHHGCASAFLDIPEIVGRASLELGRKVSYDQTLDLARAGDPAARRVLEEAARALGTLVTTVANLCLPEKILITGEGWRLAHDHRDLILHQARTTRPALASPLDLEVVPDDPYMWARGAASVAIQHSILGSPPTTANTTDRSMS